LSLERSIAGSHERAGRRGVRPLDFGDVLERVTDARTKCLKREARPLAPGAQLGAKPRRTAGMCVEMLGRTALFAAIGPAPYQRETRAQACSDPSRKVRLCSVLDAEVALDALDASP
jgi:hypothetical protein